MNSISNDLKQLIVEGLLNTPLPVKKGNAIIIGHIVIRYNKNSGYHIFDTKDSEKICTTNTKHAALGVAKLVSRGKNITDVLRLDSLLEKYSNDLIFYNYTIANSKDIQKVDMTEMRASSTQYAAQEIKTKLEKIIFED